MCMNVGMSTPLWTQIRFKMREQSIEYQIFTHKILLFFLIWPIFKPQTGFLYRTFDDCLTNLMFTAILWLTVTDREKSKEIFLDLKN